MADTTADLTALLTRLQALPPGPPPLATLAVHPNSLLATSLPALAAQLEQLTSSSHGKQSRSTSLPSSLSSALLALLHFTPSAEPDDLLRLVWESVARVVEWIVLRELAGSTEGHGQGAEGEGDEGRKQWGVCLKGILQGVLEHVEGTEQVDEAGGTVKDQPYRTLIASLLSPTLVKLVLPAPKQEGGWSEQIVESVPDLARYAALDIFNDLLSKHAPNKALARQLLPASSLGAILHSSLDFHLSQSAMEIAYRTVPPFNPKSPSHSSSNPKRVWVEELFPAELFGTDAEMFRERFYRLTGKTYYDEMPEILKLISFANIKRSQPFMVQSLVYNSTRVLISPSPSSTEASGETEIWFCQHSILGLLRVVNGEGEAYDERFHLALGDVRDMEIENGPEGDEHFIVIELILNAPPHLGTSPLVEPAGEKEEKKGAGGKLVMKTTRRGNAFDALKKTMEERAWRYPALTPHLTSSGTSTSSRPTILHPPPPGAPPNPALTNGHTHSKKPRSSQAGPIVGFFRDPPPKPPSVNGDLDTPVFGGGVEEESQTMRRGKVLAAMAEISEDLRSEEGSARGGDGSEEEEEEGQVVREGQGGEVVIDAGEMSSDLSSIEDSDEEDVEVEVKIKSRQPSKTTTSSRKSTTTSSRKSTAKSIVVKTGPPPSPVPVKRRSPRLSPPEKQQQKRPLVREPTDSIEEESLKKPQPKPVVDEIVEADSESLPKQQQQFIEPHHSSSHEIPSNAPKQNEVPVKRPKRGASNSKPKEVAVAIAEPAAVPLKPPKKTKRARSPSPIPVPHPHAASSTPPPRPKTRTTITDQPSYPKRRKITDPSPVDEGAPYETTLEEEKRSSEGRLTLQDPKKKKGGVASPWKKYGRERKERKVAEGVKVTKIGEGKGKGKGKKVQEVEESEREDEESESEEEDEEQVVSMTTSRKKVETKKPVTDFDSLPHVKTKKKDVNPAVKSKNKETTAARSKPKGSSKKDGPPISASTTKSTKSAASRSTRGAAAKKEAPVIKKAGAKSKKAETFSQLVATPPAASPQRSPSPPAALRRISQIANDSESQQEKLDFDLGFDRPSPEVEAQQPPTPITDGAQQLQPPQQPQAEDGQKSTGSLPLEPALDPSFVRNALGEDRSGDAPPVVLVVEEVEQPHEEEPQQEQAVEEVGDRAELQQVEKESPAPEVEIEEEQPAPVVEDELQAIELDEQPAPRAQPNDDRISRSPSAAIEEQQPAQLEQAPHHGLRLGDHVLGPTPAPQQDEQLQGFAVAEEESTIDLSAERARVEESLQAQDADVESAAEDEVQMRAAGGEEMVVDAVGEDSGFFGAEDDEVLAAEEQQKQDAAAAVELVPNTSSAPQPSFEQLGARLPPAPKLNPVVQPPPQLNKSLATLLPRVSPLLAKSNPPRLSRISILANQVQPRGIFSSPRPVPPKALVPPRPRRRASSEPPSGRREGGEGSPMARAGSHGRHSEPEPKRMKEKQGRGKGKTGSKKKVGRKSKGKERQRVVYSDEEPNEGGYEQDFEQELRAQLDDMVNYIVLKAQARRLASAQAFEASQRRISKHFAKGADSMHKNTVAVAITSREQVEQLKSVPVKLAALRDRQRQANKVREVELAKT